MLQVRRTRGHAHSSPVYVGSVDAEHRPIEVTEPTRLTDPLTPAEEASLEGWAAATDSYETTELSPDDHRVDTDDES